MTIYIVIQIFFNNNDYLFSHLSLQAYFIHISDINLIYRLIFSG